MNAAEKAVLQLVVYYDLFEQTLSLYELWQLLPPLGAWNADFQAFVAAFQLSETLRERLTMCGDYVVLTGREQLIELRLSMAPVKHKLWRRAQWMTQIVRLIPFVRMVGVSGSLAQESAKADSDIDFFIIAQSGYIWWVRFWSKLILKLTRLDRSPRQTGGHFCYNHYVTTQSLRLDSQSEYVARLFCHLVPVYGFATYRDFCAANTWIALYVERFPVYHFPEFDILTDHGLPAAVKKGWEKMLRGKLGKKFEQWLKTVQLRRILSDDRRLSPGSQVVTEDDLLRFHLEAKEPLVAAHYAQRLAELGLNC